MKKVQEESKYMVGLIIMFVVMGVVLILGGLFMLFLVAYMRNLAL